MSSLNSAFPCNFHNKKMSSQLTTESFWCFDCQSTLPTLSAEYSCSKCHSTAVEQITQQNDPRKHQVPVVPAPQTEEDEDISLDIMTHIIRIGDRDLTITIINTSSGDSANTPETMIGNQLRRLSLFRMLGHLFAGSSDQTPATRSQIERLETTETVQCSVCQEDETQGQGYKLSCGHSFHKECILPWFQRKNTCPSCRKQLPVQ